MTYVSGVRRSDAAAGTYCVRARLHRQRAEAHGCHVLGGALRLPSTVEVMI